MKIPNAPLIPMRIRPWEALFLAAYLEHRSRAETCVYLSGFLAYAASSVIKGAVGPMVGRITFEHHCEQNEAFLNDLLSGLDLDPNP